MRMRNFEGKTILVTGASSGIGKAVALLLAERGANVIVAARRAAQLEDTSAAIRDAGGVATVVTMDIADSASVADAFATIGSRFERLDGAFNNAGLSHGYKALLDLDEDEIRAVLETNLYGTIACMRHELRLMLAQGGGAILNTGSTTSLTGGGHIAVYTATKHAIAGLTKSTAIEYASSGVRINCLCPGGVKTEMTVAAQEQDPSLQGLISRIVPMKRMAEPREIAEVACFMLSDAASFMTGSVVLVDGGQTVGFSVAPAE